MMLIAVLAAFLCVTVGGQYNSDNRTIAYDPGELLSKIFSGNLTQPRRIIKFDDQLNENYVSFDEQNSNQNDQILDNDLAQTMPFRFKTRDEDKNLNVHPNDEDDATRVNFNEFEKMNQRPHSPVNSSFGNAVETGNEGNVGKKKKRRRRKPKQLPGYLNPGYPGPIAFGPGPGQNVQPNRFRPDFNGQFYRPPRRPQPSLASDAFAAITGALTSIAHNDDYQCVARLLCEAAAGGALGGSNLLDSVSGLQPLLTLLSAYNGISSNPLFVFGRAAFLGMSSKANPGSCRYAYPLCPTDPEQLVHYLNNHNGGFFRFFNAPQQGQQNLEQFYNQLSQNYALYQPGPGNNQEFYGLLNPGLHQNPGSQPNLYPYGYGNQQSYGFAYPYNQNYNNVNNVRFKGYKEVNDDRNKLKFSDSDRNRIEKRIQNKPATFLNNNSEEGNSKWLFPGEDDDEEDNDLIGAQYVNSNDFRFTDNRQGKRLKFPEASSTFSAYDYQIYDGPTQIHTDGRKDRPKGISFPDNQNYVHNYNINDDYNPVKSNENFFFKDERNQGIKDNFNSVIYNYSPNNNIYQDEPGVTLVYVVRGNSDPNKPEIVKLRPGEKL